MSLPLPGTVLAEKYRLEALLGEGGMGAVFRARHVLMDTPVALKWLRPDVIDSPDARERLLREARAVARIRHPNVVHVYDVDIHDGAPFIVMELLEGESFADLIARESLPVQRVIELLMGAMRGLSAAHENGIVHRDIKPENIFIARDRRNPDGIPKLLDFGVSKSIDSDFDGRITPNGHSVGTPIFMSIEQLNGSGEIDTRSDVYAFGVVLYRALTGNLPFDGDTFASIVIDIATKRPPSPKQLRPDIPSSLDHIVMKAMARDRDDRFPSIDALIAALRDAEETFGHTPPSVYAAVLTPKPPAMGPLHTEADSSSEFYPSSSLRRFGRSYAVLAAVCLGVAVLGWAMFSEDDAPTQAVREPAVPALPALPEKPAASSQKAPSPSASPTPDHAPAAPTLTGQPPAASARIKPRPSPSARAGEGPSGAKAAVNKTAARAAAESNTAPAKSTPAAAAKDAEAARPAAAPAKPTAPARRGRSGGLSRDDF